MSIDGSPLPVISLGEGWFAAEVPNPLPKGRYTLEITASDLAGNTVHYTAPFGIDHVVDHPEVDGLIAWAGGEVRGKNGALISGARVVVRGLEGAYRTEANGAYTVAVPGFDDDEGQLQILEFSAPGYITSYRRVKLYPGTINTIPVVYLKERDHYVTMMGPEGGSITNSDGSIVVDFPAGVLTTPQAIQATNYEAGYELAFPLPNTVTFTYALELIPEGLTFPEPVSVRMRNDLGFAPGTPIPVGYFNPDAVRWQHESMAFVSEDGEWVEFEVTHFSVRDINLPAAPVSIPSHVEGAEGDLNPQQEEVDPYVTIGRGVGTVGFSLPEVLSLNAPQAVSFVYRSDNASSSRLIDLSYDLSFHPSAVLRFSVGIGGVTDEAVYSNRSTDILRTRTSSLMVERPFLETGLYPSLRSIANELEVPFGAFAGAGRRWGSREELISDVRGRELVSRASSIESWTFWRNESQSVFGAGWTMQSLDRVYPAPGNRSVVLARGDGGFAVFQPGDIVEQPLHLGEDLSAIQAIEASPEGGFIFSSDGELYHWNPGSEPVFISEGVRRLQDTGYGDLQPLPMRIEALALSETGEIYLSAYPQSGWGVMTVTHQLSSSNDASMTTGIFRRSLYDDEVAEILPLIEHSTSMSYDWNSGSIYFLDRGRLYSTSEDGSLVPVWHDFVGIIAFAIDQNRARIVFATQNTVYAADISDDVETVVPVELFSLSNFTGDEIVFHSHSLTVAPSGTISALARQRTHLSVETQLLQLEANGAIANSFSIGRNNANLRLISDVFGTLYLIRGSSYVSRLDLRSSQGFVNQQYQLQFLSKIPTGWKWEDVSGNLKFFNSEGLLTEERDRNGNVTTYTYDQEMRLRVKTDPSGRETHFAYTAEGRIDTITDAVGRTTRFFHNTSGQLIRVSFPDGSERTFEYDQKHRMLGFADEEGHYTEFSISKDGIYREIHFPDGGKIELSGARTRATGTRPELPAVPLVSAVGLPPAASGNEMDTIVNQLGSQFEYKTDARGQFTHVKDAEGHEVFFNRDATGRLTSVRNPGIGRRTYHYNDYGNLIQSTREDNRSLNIERLGPFNFPSTIVGYGEETTLIHYDLKGNPTRVTDPLQRETVFTYNSRGQPTTVTNPQGEQWIYNYDSLGNLISATDPSGGTTFLSRNTLGQIASVTDPTGRTTSFTYDLMGRLLTTTYPDGAVWRQTYTARGLLESVTDPLGHLTRYFYDSKGRLITLLDSSGGETHYTYDAADNLRSVTNPEGEVTFYTYNGNNKLVSVQKGDLPPTVLTYDALGRLLSVTDPNGQVTSRVYDSVGRVISLERPDGETLFMEYDARDNLIRLEDPSGGEMQWSYDLAGRRLSETNAIGQTFHYTYDGADRLIRAVNRRGQVIEYDYDPAGRMIRLAMEGGDLNTYTYDAAGRLTHASNPHSSITLNYDVVGRLTASSQTAGDVSYAYNLAGKLTQRTHPGGTETFGYDAAGRLNQVTSTTLGSFTMGYDAASRMNTIHYPNAVDLQIERDAIGRRESMDYNRGGMSIMAHHQHLDAAGNVLEDSRTVFPSRTFEYDVLDRLTSVASGGLLEEAFAYDRLGNWLVDGRIHDLANRLLSDEWASFAYDADGNLTEVDGEDEFTRYAYDALGRLESATVSGQEVHYRYDPLGRRYSVSLNGTETLTLFDGWEEMGTRKNGVFYPHLSVGGMRLGAVTEQGVVYLHAGLEGSIQAASDASGTIVQHYQYSAFGLLNVFDAEWTLLEPAEALSPWLYHGRLYEPETGLYWMRARHYSPELGRFLQPDPIGVAGGINLYAYANNNPLRWFDPWGLDPVSVEGAQGGISAGGGGLLYRMFGGEGQLETRSLWGVSNMPINRTGTSGSFAKGERRAVQAAATIGASMGGYGLLARAPVLASGSGGIAFTGSSSLNALSAFGGASQANMTMATLAGGAVRSTTTSAVYNLGARAVVSYGAWTAGTGSLGFGVGALTPMDQPEFSSNPLLWGFQGGVLVGGMAGTLTQQEIEGLINYIYNISEPRE